MQQQQIQSTRRTKRYPSHPLQSIHLLSRVRLVLFPTVIILIALLIWSTLLLGFSLWQLARVVQDRREYWRNIWAFAVFCTAVYAVWQVVFHPIADLWETFRLDLALHLWQKAPRPVVLFWLLHLWLSPLAAPVLAGLYPRSHAGPLIKVPTVQDEQDERMRITSQQTRLQTMLASMHEPPRPAAVTLSLQHSHAYPLGQYVRGELAEHVIAGLYRLPASFFEVHGVVIGEPKAGKSTTLVKLAAIARAYGRRIIFLDLKGSRRTAALFLSAMSLFGAQTIRLFPAQAYDGWRGDAQALYNRLM